MFTIRKPKAEKILTGKARFSCSDNILSYPPFYPLLRLLLPSLLLFLMQWPKPMITRLLLPSPKTTSLLQLIDSYSIGEKKMLLLLRLGIRQINIEDWRIAKVVQF